MEENLNNGRWDEKEIGTDLYSPCVYLCIKILSYGDNGSLSPAVVDNIDLVKKWAKENDYPDLYGVIVCAYQKPDRKLVCIGLLDHRLHKCNEIFLFGCISVSKIEISKKEMKGTVKNDTTRETVDVSLDFAD